MKKYLLIGTLLPQLALAATPINGWYGSVFGGYLYQPDNISKTRFGLVFNDVHYQGGYDVGGSFGFKSAPLRYEAELSYLNSKVNSLRINNHKQLNPDGTTDAVLGMANVFYDFPGITAPIEPYLGVGLGYGRVSTDFSNYGVFGYNKFEGASSVFAYQAMAGLTYNFAENYAATLGYRYVGTERVHELGKIFQAHIANIGIVYRFDAVRYK